MVEELFQRLPVRYQQIGTALAFVPKKDICKYTSIQTRQRAQRLRIYSDWCDTIKYYFDNKEHILDELGRKFSDKKVERITRIIGMMVCSA